VYERAIANVPPAEEKRYWQRYIYLWINYALYEELDAQDIERTREVYKECLRLIPHKKFTFAKMWLMAAQFEIRQRNLKAARQILGNAIGMASKGKIFNILKLNFIWATLTVVGLFMRNILNGPQQTVMPGGSMPNWRRTLVRLIVHDQYMNLLLHSQPLIRQRFCGRYVLLQSCGCILSLCTLIHYMVCIVMYSRCICFFLFLNQLI
jgi:tetratricopeptide (TPR) repeat protein